MLLEKQMNFKYLPALPWLSGLANGLAEKKIPVYAKSTETEIFLTDEDVTQKKKLKKREGGLYYFNKKKIYRQRINKRCWYRINQCYIPNVMASTIRTCYSFKHSCQPCIRPYKAFCCDKKIFINLIFS